MASANVNSVYIHVMEDVISNVRADFQSEGVEDSVLHVLQALWELKMMQSGAITGPISGASSIHTRAGTVPPTPVQDLNIPYEATDDYEAPATEMLFPGDVAEEDYNEPGEEEARGTSYVAQKPIKEEGTESEGSEPPLNEEGDDEDDMNDIGHGDDELKTNHLVLAQFEKVTRTKNKWKCILKDGIMHLNNRDILFVKANGEFEF